MIIITAVISIIFLYLILDFLNKKINEKKILASVERNSRKS